MKYIEMYNLTLWLRKMKYIWKKMKTMCKVGLRILNISPQVLR